MDTFFKKTLPYAGMMIVVIVVGYFARQNHNIFEKDIVDQYERQLLETAHSEARLLNQQVLNLTQELEILSTDEAVKKAFSYNYRKAKDAGFFLLDDSYRDVKSMAVSLSLIDAKGVVIYEVPSKGNAGKDFSSELDIRKGLVDHQIYASGIIKAADGGLVLTFEQPVFNQKKFVGLLRAVISLETLQANVIRNEKKGLYSFLLDNENRFLSYPDSHYLGQGVSTLFEDGHLALGKSRFNPLLAKMAKGMEGSGVCLLFPLDSPHQAEDVIVAFSPVFFGGKAWSYVSAIDYDEIAGPVNKNARDNILFAGVVFFLLFLSAFAFYQDQKRKNEELRRLYENLAKNLEELKSTQAMLIQSAKMESVGQLAAGVAHEVKNPLAIILLVAKYLKNNVKFEDEHIPALLDDIENSVNRADRIVKGLLDFSSSSDLKIKRQDLHTLIDQSLALVKHLFAQNNVHVTRNFADEVIVLSVDGNKIEQVFVNLFMNAIQAMPGGGEFSIETFEEDAGDDYWAVVRIEDTGSGLPEKVQKDLFVPFTTTKRGSGGTGLGLSIVRNIMEMHGGRITLENRTEKQGVRVTLRFKMGGGA
ncbi:MAG: hypothetical protein HQL16_05000 [Candidatus Omnitrophica bacterium]|nr:hypothetical protein [Candidatus Omnitrophota bacterium]